MGKLRFRPVKKCAFCNNRPNSKEHAWPEWVLKKMHRPTGLMIGTIEEQQADFERTQRAIKVRCVCDSCNKYWMKDLEDTAKVLIGPLIDDVRTTLNPLQQAYVAMWAVKTAMVFEFVTCERELFYTDRDRSDFKNSVPHYPPPFTSVWISRFSGPLVRMLTFAAEATIGDFRGSLARLYVTTITFGAFVIQVVSVRPDQGKTFASIIHPKHGPWFDCTRRIWPTTRLVAWPPFMTISDPRNLIHLHERWKNPTAEHGGFTSEDYITLDRIH
jgi:hypothetical protein